MAYEELLRSATSIGGCSTGGSGPYKPERETARNVTPVTSSTGGSHHERFGTDRPFSINSLGGRHRTWARVDCDRKRQGSGGVFLWNPLQRRAGNKSRRVAR